MSVLARIRSELGPDAVILSNQTCQEDGSSVCEIMAAVEDEETEAQARPQAQGPSRSAKARQGGSEVRQPPAQGDWKREWADIKSHMLALLRPHLDFGRLVPRQRLALEYLEREGVEESVILALFRNLEAGRSESVLDALSALIPFTPLGDDNYWPQTIQAVAGPAGDGKTSVMLRLAIAAKKRDPAAEIVLASLAGEAGKGRLFLKHYAELSGLKHVEFLSEEDLQRLVKSVAGKGRVFLEIPAPERGQTLAARLRNMGLKKRKDFAVHLVLAPFYSNTHYAHLLSVFDPASVDSVVWSKCDLAASYGAIINLAHTSGLPVSALSIGSNLSETLCTADAELVWRVVFKHELPKAETKEQAAPARRV